MLSPHPVSMISLMPVEGLAIRVAEGVVGCVLVVGAAGGVVRCRWLVCTTYGPSIPETDRIS